MLIDFAGSTVSYSFTVMNNGNVKQRSIALDLPQLAGTSTGSSITISCVDPVSRAAWTTADLPAGASLACSGHYTLGQDAIEAGDLNPVLTASSLDLPSGPLVTSLPTVTVPNTPSLFVSVDTAACTLPARAGMNTTKTHLDEGYVTSAMADLWSGPACICCRFQCVGLICVLALLRSSIHSHMQLHALCC